MSRSAAKKLIDNSKEAILEAIDEASAPDQMTLVEAKRFLEDLHMEVQCRLDGIADDLKMAESE